MPQRRYRQPGVTYLHEVEFAVGGTGLNFDIEPADLSELALEEWRRIATVYADADEPRFREADRAAMEAYCRYFAVFRQASTDVESRGHLVQGRSQSDRTRLVKNPSLQVMRDASYQLRFWARELGFSPDARGRMGITDTIRRQHAEAEAAADAW